MTEKEIDKIAAKVAELVLAGILQSDLIPFEDEQEEQDLLTELAQAMTQLDYNLQKENYEKCKELQDKIKIIENKLKNYK
jgi:protein-arginine kinase activator protein McsA